MSGTLEFIAKRFMANDVDLLGLDKSPIGTLTLGDCGRSDRDMQNGSGREFRATHESISCSLTDCGFRLSPVWRSEEVTRIAESGCNDGC
jgi:hypothetical protein